MPFETGQQLLHYRLIEQIGQGGMGLVWKALDTGLDREVAIKILPQAFAGQSDRLARFEREAKLLASLNHPNIAAVYGLHEADVSGEAVHFIAMELVGGEDLEQRLQRGPLPIAEALEIASQIAQGLSAAHETGVIHRDLKPANVKLTEDGKAKVLDFGLAKAPEPAAASGNVDLTHSPTVTSAGTVAGMILGTAAYMSPEQARGKPADRRADIWSFGALLFEMLSGQKPFPGETVSDILAKILERSPPWGALPTPLNPGLRRLLERCLAKDPERRLRDAADVRLELQELLKDPTGAKSAGASTAAPGPVKPARSSSLAWALLAGLAVMIVGFVGWTALNPSGDEPVVRFEINPPQAHQFGEFAAAPDGTAVAFVAVNRQTERSLWIRRFDSIENRRLSATEGAFFPFWSPDMQSIAFFSQGKLRRIDLASETIQTIADAPNARGGCWASDGTILFTPDGADVLYAVPASGGTPMAKTALREGETSHRFPHMVSGTRDFVFVAQDNDALVTRRYLGSLDSDRMTLLSEGLSEMYAPPGRALFVDEATLFVRNFDSAAGELSGEPFPLARDVRDAFPRTASSAFSVSDNGTLMFLESTAYASRIDAYDKTGRLLETVAPAGNYQSPVLSHDGKHVAFLQDVGEGLSSLWHLDLVRGSTTRLPGLTDGFWVSWSSDDQSVFFYQDGKIFNVATSGGDAALVFDTAQLDSDVPLDAIRKVGEARDGSFLVFAAWDPVTDYDLWRWSRNPPRVERLANEPGWQAEPVPSPNMRWIAYESQESGRYEVFVRSLGASAAKSLVSNNGGVTPAWSSDGRTLYYIGAERGLMAVSVSPTAGRFDAGLPVRLFNAPTSVEEADARFFRQPYLVGVDGDRFLLQVPDEEVRDRTIEVVLNWEQLLNRSNEVRLRGKR